MPDADHLSHHPAADAVIAIRGLEKTYAGGFQALKGIDLTVRRGEIFALLGPNGAGKTTLISIACGIVNPTRGAISVAGHDVVREWRHTRSIIGLVPQELTTDAFESVWNTVRFSRGLFGKAPDDAYLEQLLKDLSLWEKRHNKVMTLSGGMKRRVMIAKALSHQPTVLFLDEPSAGVDVELRRDMWAMVRRLRDAGVTIILTTHYIEEAEDMADRVGVINHGELIVVEQTATLMQKLGKKQLRLQLHEPLPALPAALSAWSLELNPKGDELTYTYDTQGERTGITALLKDLAEAGVHFKDLSTRQDSLEQIFVDLVRGRA
ncbi:MAG TPA: ABC transporter ATP-binding protein [Rhodanobacteraceae bacterium]